MNQQNLVLFKGTKDGVTLLFSEDAPFSEICKQLKQKVTEAERFFNHVKTALIFKGRVFTEEEEKELLTIISENTSMNITFLKTENDELQQIPYVNGENVEQQNITKFHKGSLRNGQQLFYDGSIVIIGDVNPGAEVRATGNIIILGQLKGIAHAGCQGLMSAFVIAVYMAPVQLRIADIITCFPEENKHGAKPAEYAFVQNEQIFVMPLS